MSARYLIIASLALSGCVSVLPEPRVPEGLYRLSSGAGEFAETDPVMLPASITVFEPAGAEILLGRSIVYEEPDGSLKLLSSAQWSDSSSRQLQSALLDRLTMNRPDDGAAALSDRLGAIADFELQWEIRDFVIRDSEAVISIRGLVSHFRSGKIRPFDLALSEPYTGDPASAGVKALIKGSRDAVNQIALQLPALMDSATPSAES